MRTAVLVVFTMLLLGGVAWWILSVTGEGGELAGTRAAPTPANTEPQPGAAAPGRRPQATAAPGIETVPFAPPAEAPVVEQGFRVRVVGAGSKRPLPRIVVGFVDLQRLDPTPLVNGDIAFYDVEAIVMRCGIKLQADEAGEVLVPVPGGEALICAQTKTRFGLRQFTATEPEPVLLECRPIRYVHVQVVDGTGQPQAGIPVSLAIDMGMFSPVIWRGETRGAEGRVTFRDVRFLDSLMKLDGGLGGKHDYVVQIAIPLQKPVKAKLPDEQLREEPIRLELPPTARVVVDLVAPAGQALPGPVRVLLSKADSRLPDSMGIPTLLDATALAARITGSTVTFDHVGLGLQLAVEAADTARAWIPARKSVAGPTVAQAEVRVEVAFGKRAARLVGRVVDPEGAPAPGLSLRLEGLPFEWQTNLNLISRAIPIQTDARGRFAIVVNGSGVEKEPEADLVITTRLAVAGAWSEAERRASVHVRGPFREGENDLGDVVLRPLPRLVSGVVLDDQDRPVSRASVSLDKGAPSGTLSDAEGRFSIHGESTETSFELSVAARGFSGATRTVRAGDEVTVRLRPAGGLRGNVLLPEGMEADRVVVRAGEVKTKLEDDGTFALTGLLPGTVDLGFVLEEERQVLETVSGLRVLPGQTRADPRLKDVDLRPHLNVFEVIVTDAQENPIAEADVWRLDERAQPSSSAETDRQGRCVHVAASPQLAVRIVREGFEARQVTLSPGRNRVSLSASVTLAFALAPDSALPDVSLTLMTMLAKVGADGQLDTTGRMWRQSFGGLKFDRSWRDERPLSGAGTYTVTFLVMRSGQQDPGSTLLASAEPVKVVIAKGQSGRIARTVRFTSEAIRAALEKMR